MRRLAVTVALGLAIASCGGTGDDAGTTASPTATSSPVSTSPVTTSPTDTAPPTTSPIGEGNGPRIDPADVAAPPDAITESGRVVRVIDGDSIEVEIDGTDIEVRMVGINAPERDECHGDTSRDTLAAIVESADDRVDIELADDGTDQFGRALAFVSAEGVDINALLVATGNAIPLHGHQREDRYFDLAEEAFASNAGLWELGGCGEPGAANFAVDVADIEVDPPGRDDENLNGEFVTLRNTTTEPIDMSGWTLRDESTANRYVFPTGTRLEAGALITVFVGCGTDGTDAVYWCSDTPVWSNGGDSVLILDAAGNVIWWVLFG